MANDVPIDEVEDTRESRKMDPELLVMSRMIRLLDELEPDAKARIVVWLHDRHTRAQAREMQRLFDAGLLHRQ